MYRASISRFPECLLDREKKNYVAREAERKGKTHCSFESLESVIPLPFEIKTWQARARARERATLLR